MCKSFVQFLSIQYHFSVDRQLDTSGHVLGEVGLCDRLSEDLVTTPSLAFSLAYLSRHKCHNATVILNIINKS